MKKTIGRRAALYLRCSDAKQDMSIEEQRDELGPFCAQNSYTIVAGCDYEDEGISGDSTEERPGFMSMIEDSQKGLFDVIVCWNQDRFGRFDNVTAGHYAYLLRKAGVQLHTYTDGLIDWNESSDRINYATKQEAKREDSVTKGLNVIRGQAKAAKLGSWSGAAPYAFRIVGPRFKKKLELDDPAKADIVRRIFREYTVEERSLWDIARRLTANGIPAPKGGRWRYDGIKSILENPFYKGTFRWNHKSYGKYARYRNGNHVKSNDVGKNATSDMIVNPDLYRDIALVDDATFEMAQSRLAKGRLGKRRYTPEDNRYLFSGKLICGRCGSPMWGISRRGEPWYTCGKHDYNQECEGTSISEAALQDFLGQYISEEFIPDDMDDYRNLHKKARAGTLEEADLPEAFAKLKRMFVADTKPKFDPKRIKREIDQLSAKIEQARLNLAVIKKPENIPAVEHQIAEWEKQRDEKAIALQQTPTEADINASVRAILRMVAFIGMVTEVGKEAARQFLQHVDRIVIHTTITGSGTGIRHAFEHGEIHFKLVKGLTGESNLRLLVQSQTAYR